LSVAKEESEKIRLKKILKFSYVPSPKEKGKRDEEKAQFFNVPSPSEKGMRDEEKNH